MIRWLAGPLIAALLIPSGAMAGQPAIAVRVIGDDGAPIASLPLGAGGVFCLRWNHSVTGGKVADCFRIADGVLVLDRSYLHDYAAGLGDIPGRGRVRAAEGGGYWIEDIDEPVAGNRLRLRVGSRAVDHRLTAPGHEIDLSKIAAGRGVILRPADRGDER